jgi:hypothetical protein
VRLDREALAVDRVPSAALLGPEQLVVVVPVRCARAALGRVPEGGVAEGVDLQRARQAVDR